MKDDAIWTMFGNNSPFSDEFALAWLNAPGYVQQLPAPWSNRWEEVRAASLDDLRAYCMASV